MSKGMFDPVVASERYQSAVAALTAAQLKTIFAQGVRIYAGIHDLRGNTHVELSPGEDGVYSEFVVQQFESGRWEYVYIDPEALDYAMAGTLSAAGLPATLRDCLGDSCSYDAEGLFENFLRAETDRYEAGVLAE